MNDDSRSSRTGRRAPTLLLAALALGLAGCAMHWPWKQRAPPPPPAPVNEVAIAAAAETAAATASAATAPAITQYWDRNTLMIDLTAVSGSGAAIVTPLQGRGWPVRLEFRVTPGRIARLDVRGAQRVVYTVPQHGAPLLLRLAPGAYRPDTARISLRWSAADDLPR